MRSEHNGGTLVDAGGESAAGDGDRRENGLNVEHWCVVEVRVLVSGFFHFDSRCFIFLHFVFSLASVLLALCRMLNHFFVSSFFQSLRFLGALCI